MGQGDIPTSPGGPLRRRREKRQLQQLAGEVRREPSSSASRAHVNVIEDQMAPPDREPAEQTPEAPLEANEPRARGFRVHAVPIDEPIDKR